MKYCPECNTRNQHDNLFCPTCGHSFLPDPDEERKPAAKPPGRKKRNVAIALAVVVALGLAAGLTSFFVSREIQRSMEVTVRTGTVWKCTRCGKTYKERVVELAAKKSESDLYNVETLEGECYRCRYGPLVGSYQEFFDLLSRRRLFAGRNLEMRPAAAEFIAEHPDLFPAASEDAAGSLVVDRAPPAAAKDIDSLGGRPIRMKGTVADSQVIEAEDGSKMTYLKVTPDREGTDGAHPAQAADVRVLVFYPGVSGLKKGETATFYVLPVWAVRYSGDGGPYDLVTVGMFIVPGH